MDADPSINPDVSCHANFITIPSLGNKKSNKQ